MLKNWLARWKNGAPQAPSGELETDLDGVEVPLSEPLASGSEPPTPDLPSWVIPKPTYTRVETSVFRAQGTLENLLGPYLRSGRKVTLNEQPLSLEKATDHLLGAWFALADVEARKHGVEFVTRWSRLGKLVDLYPTSWIHGTLETEDLLACLIHPLLEQPSIELRGVFEPVAVAVALGQLPGVPADVLRWGPQIPPSSSLSANASVQDPSDVQSIVDIVSSMHVDTDTTSGEEGELGNEGDGDDQEEEHGRTAMDEVPEEQIRASVSAVLERSGGAAVRYRKVLRQEGAPPSRRSDQEIYDRLVDPLRQGLALKPWPPTEIWNALRREFPWAVEACQDLERLSGLAHFVGQPMFHLPPVLLVGAPGNGKTRFAGRVAQLSAVPRFSISAAGKNNGQLLMGVERSWGNAQPSSLLQFMVKKNTANPMVVVDELDKAAQETRNGDLGATLLPFLEPESARSINDDFLLAEVDFSCVSWVATANDTASIPGALLSRFKVIEMGKPRPDHLEVLCEGIRHDLAEQFDVPLENLPELSEADLARLKKKVGLTFSAREVRLGYESLLADRARTSRFELVR